MIWLLTMPDQNDFHQYLKPKVSEVLIAVALDKTYCSAAGDFLFYKNKQGKNKKVLALVGGFGSTILGHNNPELVEVLVSALTRQVPVMAQASIRSEAGLLSKKLATLMRERTSEDWIVTLTNSGAECVEAAIKHAMYKQQLSLIHI